MATTAKPAEITEPPSPELPTVIDPETGQADFDAEVRRLLGISGEAFIRRWEAGEFDHVADDSPEGRQIIWLALLIPFARANG